MFDPYRKWLGIPEGNRPPTHYQLLAISPDEKDPEVINAAVVRQSAYVRNFQSGKFADDATRVLNEIAAAKTCLFDAAKRTAYDAKIKKAEPPAAKQEPARQTAPQTNPADRPSLSGVHVISAPPVSLSPPSMDHAPMSPGYAAAPYGYDVYGMPLAAPGYAPMQQAYAPMMVPSYPAQAYPTQAYPTQAYPTPGYPLMAEEDFAWWQKVPAWAWGTGGAMLVLLVVGIGLLISGGPQPAPTNSTVATAGPPPNGTAFPPTTNNATSGTPATAGSTSSGGPFNPATASTSVKPPKSTGSSPAQSGDNNGDSPFGKSSSDNAVPSFSSGRPGEPSKIPSKSKPADSDGDDEPVSGGSLESGEVLQPYNKSDRGTIGTLLFSSESQYLLSCCAEGDHDGSLRLWEIAQGREHHKGSGSDYPRYNEPFVAAVFLDDPFQIVSLEMDSFAKVHRFRGEELDHQSDYVERNYRFGKPTCAAISAGGRVAAWGNETYVAVSECRRDGLTGLIMVPDAVKMLAVSPDGRLVSAALFDRSVHTWSNSRGAKDLFKAWQTDGAVTGLAFSPDGERMAAICDDGTLYVWEAGRRKEVFQKVITKRKPSCLAFSPDNTKLIVGDKSGFVLIVRADDGKQTALFQAESSGQTTSVALSSDGKLAATGSNQGAVRVWKLDELPAGK